MQVIPVIDVLRGQVVRAQRGERHRYQPVRSTLADGSAPGVIAAALRRACPPPDGAGELLYMADLDALGGGALQVDAVDAVLAALGPDARLWLDGGFSGLAPAKAACARWHGRVQPVLASEALADARELQALAGDASAVLSLDSRQARPMDRAGVWQQPQWWPHTVIAMTLDRVGSDAGPDLDALRALRARAQAAGAATRRWIGSGGVRDAADLVQGAAAGADGWLVASALHDGRLQPGPARAAGHIA